MACCLQRLSCRQMLHLHVASIFHVPWFWKIIMTAMRCCRLLKKHTVFRSTRFASPFHASTSVSPHLTHFFVSLFLHVRSVAIMLLQYLAESICTIICDCTDCTVICQAEQARNCSTIQRPCPHLRLTRAIPRFVPCARIDIFRFSTLSRQQNT